MKHVIPIFLPLLLAFCIVSSCTKDTIDTPPQKNDCPEKTIVIEILEGLKFGALKIWFPTSNSTDNALTGEPRKHEIFNQSKIQYQKFTPTGEPGFFYNNVFHWSYIMECVFENDSIGVHKVGVGFVDGNQFTHYPDINDNLLSNNHPAYVVSYTATTKSVKYTNGKRNQLINLKSVELAYDGIPIEIQTNTPMTQYGNHPDYGHQY